MLGNRLNIIWVSHRKHLLLFISIFIPENNRTNMLEQIYFKNYKAFAGEECLDIRPITILVGKNSSGKSSICKLLPLFENTTSGNMDSVLLLNNLDISLGSRYEDLFHNNATTDLQLGLKYDNGIELSATYLMNEGSILVYEYSARIYDKARKMRFTESQSKSELFQGLVNERIFEEIGINKSDIRFHVDYIGPIRIDPSRIITFEGYKKYANVGIKGENTYSILLNSYLQKDKLFERVSQWMEENLEGQKLVIEQNSPSSGTYSIYVQRNGSKVNIADVGQGLGQVLPVIVQSYMNNEVDVAVIEQPVLHLHPAAHANVAYRLAESALETRKKYIIETHSENIILGIRKLISDPASNLSPEDVVIYFIDTDGESAYLDKIEINEAGELSKWPTGVFSESFDLMAEIMRNKK
jgi:predicted ATPase